MILDNALFWGNNKQWGATVEPDIISDIELSLCTVLEND